MLLCRHDGSACWNPIELELKAVFSVIRVDGDGFLALVEPLPIEAPAAGVERPAVEVRAAADGVEADHLGAQLGEIEPATRPGHEGRDVSSVDRHGSRRAGYRRRGGSR